MIVTHLIRLGRRNNDRLLAVGKDEQVGDALARGPFGLLLRHIKRSMGSENCGRLPRQRAGDRYGGGQGPNKTIRTTVIADASAANAAHVRSTCVK